MSVTFRSALLISASLHISAIGPSLSSDFTLTHKMPEADAPMVVDYLVAKEPENSLISKKAILAASVESIGSKNADIQVAGDDVVNGRRPFQNNIAGKRQAAGVKNGTPAKKGAAINDVAIKEMVKRQDHIKSTREFINYFNLIREKIRQKLKTNYMNCGNEGEIHLVFVLNADGSLVAIDTEKDGLAYDKRLARIAASSVRQASPFWPFPKELSLPQMYFNLVVSFKKR